MPSAGLQAGVLGQVSWSRRPPGSYAETVVHQCQYGWLTNALRPARRAAPVRAKTCGRACRRSHRYVCVFLHEQCSLHAVWGQDTPLALQRTPGLVQLAALGAAQ